MLLLGLPCGSVGKESACNSGDLGSIPGLGRSPGEGKGYPLQYSGLENSMDCIVHVVTESDMTEWLSLSFSGGKEPTFQCRRCKRHNLSQEDPLEEGMATHSSMGVEIPWIEEPGRLQSIGPQRVGHNWNDLACRHAVYWSGERL